jgi:hypothetical protein
VLPTYVQVLKVLRGFLAHRVQWVHRDFKVQRGLLEVLQIPAHRVQRVQLALLDHKVLQDLQVQRDMQVVCEDLPV